MRKSAGWRLDKERDFLLEFLLYCWMLVCSGEIFGPGVPVSGLGLGSFLERVHSSGGKLLGHLS